MARYAVYTANFGLYDWIYEPSGGGYDEVDFICFTDDPQLWPYKCKSPDHLWDIRVMPRKFPDKSPRYEAKWYKMMSHLVLPEYEATLWMDSRLQLKSLGDGFESMAYNLALSNHPNRDCWLEEAIHCMKVQADNSTVIWTQAKRYLKAGLPQHNGAWRGGILWRKPTPDVVEFNELWWDEINRGSIRDQISLPYVVYETGIEFQTWGEYMPQILGHAHHERPKNAKANSMCW